MAAISVTLMDITPRPEEKIATYAAVCYNSKTDQESNDRRIQSLLKMEHLATMRFAHATFCVEGISRICSHQFVRSKHLDFLQQSQRYVDQTNIHFTTPTSVLKNQEAINAYSQSVVQSFKTYEKLLAAGIRKEDARFVLPEATNTTLYVTGNFQAWKDFLHLRLDKAAQWEIREVAQKIQVELNKHAPNVFPMGVE